MSDFEPRLEQLDIGLFQPISTQTSRGDKRSLLKLQACARQPGQYRYLEIGSHLGGTLQPHYVDPRCERIFSIDKRPAAQPDERGIIYEYHDNSTERMRANLRTAYPQADHDRLVTFDCDASDVNPTDITPRPEFCFIDGEHTNPAVLSDFAFCRQVCADDAVIAFHDTCFVFEGVRQIQRDLTAEGVRFIGVKLGGSVYAILLGEACDRLLAELKPLVEDEAAYFERAQLELERMHLQNRYPILRMLDYPRKIFRRLRRKVG
ncbi:MAG: class I SAM-dependent methyltransferase [Planctomycetaceae bacterium]|nr:class I SAM-dependent methyltransferase [Planctomycetaceae bacterium]